MDLVTRTIGVVLANAYAFAACWVWLRLFGPKARKLSRATAAASERGQGLVEYALILVLVAVVVIGVLVVLGPSIKGLF